MGQREVAGILRTLQEALENELITAAFDPELQERRSETSRENGVDIVLTSAQALSTL